MGLPRALQAHLGGDLVAAEQHYKRALQQKLADPVLYQNYGALLRSTERIATAKAIYAEGHSLFPSHPGILANWANLIALDEPTESLQLSLSALRLQISQSVPPTKLRGTFVSAVSKLREHKLYSWALALAEEALARVGTEPQILLQILLLLEASAHDSDSPTQIGEINKDKLVILIESQLEKGDLTEQAEIRLALAAHRLGQADTQGAIAQYERAMAVLQASAPTDSDEIVKRQKLIDINSWNFGCSLLKFQDFNKGWRLFEYGLRTPAEGPQRWQRSLRKPFSSEDLPLWRGEPLSGKRLLLLEEQAIGDVMMFLTLLPDLLSEAAEIGVVLGDRLLPIYRRSFASLCFDGRLRLWSQTDAKHKKLLPDYYDVQCPLGSICQFRFTSPADYGRNLPLLQAKPSRVDQFRSEYLNYDSPVERLVGVSWRGGGKGVRIRQKSIDPNEFSRLLRPIPGVRFVSLQYGSAAPVVENWRKEGIDILHDPRVDPLKQMDLWLAQVAACDAVLSVANTTIHGAGGLGLPTMCLLSLHSDWRWFDDVTITRSYWYPSVGIAREIRDQGWNDAMLGARCWLEQGSPMPSGPVSTKQ